MNGLALTDHGNLYGALEFYQACKGEGINPIVGYEAYIAPGSRFDKEGATRSKEASYHLTLLAKNREGFRNLGEDGVERLPRGLLPQAAYRQGAARSAQRGDHLPLRLRQRRAVAAPARRHDADEALARGAEITGLVPEASFGDRYFWRSKTTASRSSRRRRS